MGKTSATIKLIQILSSRGDYVNSQDLADMLETNPRNIKEYIKEAEECGYVIESLKGVYGGYRLSRSSTMPSIKLTSDEKKALVDANEFLMKKNDFVNSQLFSLAIGKVLSDLDTANGITPITMIDRFPLAMDKSELQRRYGILNEAIETVVETGQASTSFIQRRFKVGYARAGRIIDQMEERGIISGYQGSKPREVLMSKERWEELKMQPADDE